MGAVMGNDSWPRIFHRIWLDEDERPEFAAWRDRLAELHPGWEIRTWNDSSKLGWMRYADLMQDLLRSDPFGRAPDLLRYELLWRFGGIYIDTDFEPLRSMEELIEDPRPFAGWENDRTMCTAILAAPPEHPAIGLLLDGVVDQLAATKGRPANEALGPEYATAHWRERDDVRRMPPYAFYPVGWWEKQLLGGPYPERTYAVHHWAKGWADDTPAPKIARSDAKLSILVAFRDDDGSRTAVWELIRAKLESEIDAEIVVGADGGEDPFWKTRALNAAAREASGNVLAIWDADTWCRPDLVAEATAFVAAHPDRWGRPWNVKLKLNQQATEHVLQLGASWDGTIDHRPFGKPENRNTFAYAPPMILSREAFETVGGLDERFRGWHGEDYAFALALRRLVGQQQTFRGIALHLWHPRIGRSGKDLWNGQDSDKANQDLVTEYKRARTREEMRAVVDAGRLAAV